jgi:dipeptidyl aminopeptidase/acylaminoacyl peptidase
MHGANDPRVKKSESDQIVAAMAKKRIPVTYVVFSNEGHGFMKTENTLAAAAIKEKFLHKYLGGLLEPLKEEIINSSGRIVVGNVGLEH